LIIILDTHSPDHGRTITWNGPGQATDEDHSTSDQTLLELCNKVGADGWELIFGEDQRHEGDDQSPWAAGWSVTSYTFKRRASE